MRFRKPQVQSATSIDRAPTDDATVRMRNYLITMAIRTLCVVLTALVTPYSWYTAVFAAGAIFLPYIAVVIANVSVSAHVNTATPPTAPAILPTSASSDVRRPADQDVIRLSETPTSEDER